MPSQWNSTLRHPAFRWQFLGSVAFFILTLSLFTRFLGWVEQREGAVLSDPLLVHIQPMDLTWLTFTIIYLAIVLAVVYLSGKPKGLLLAIQAYTVMVIFRAIMMFLTPLNPAEGLIVLHDPFVQFFGDGSAPTKDLFFSGHTSTLFLLALVIRQRTLKTIYLLFTLLVAVCVVWQHVHYVIDVVVAPFVAYASYRIVCLFQERTLAGEV